MMRPTEIRLAATLLDAHDAVRHLTARLSTLASGGARDWSEVSLLVSADDGSDCAGTPERSIPIDILLLGLDAMAERIRQRLRELKVEQDG
jgi:hypothetical protein